MKPNLFYVVCIIVFCQNLCPPITKQVDGQGLPYVIEHYTSENGLPQNSIKFLLFDKNGYLWMGSEAGLIRFDNKELKVYGINNIPGLLDARIQDMKLDTAGNVYAENLHYQNIVTKPMGHFMSPLPWLMKGESPYYYPTWGYLNKNPIIGSLWDSISATSNLPTVRKHASLANGDIYLFYEGNVYYINHGYHLLKTWSQKPIENIALGAKYMLQFWKTGKIAVWENGQLLQQTKLKGEVLKSAHFLQGDFMTFWCPTGSFILVDNALYRIFMDHGVITTKLVLKALSIESPDCLYYNPSNNTYYFGSRTAGFYVIKVSDFEVPPTPKQTGANYFYSIAKLPGDSLVVRNTIIPPSGEAYYKEFKGNFYTSYVDSAGVLYYENEYSFNSYQPRTDIVKELLPLEEHLVSILPYSGNKLLLCTHASYRIVSKEGNVFAQKRLPIDYSDVKAKGLFPIHGDHYYLLTTNGLKWYNLKTNKIEKTILDSVSFRSFYADKHGRLWLGSDGSGGFMYKEGKVYKLPLGPLNAFNTIHAFIDDHKGHFWLTTNNGLYRVSIQNMVDYLTGKVPEFHFYALDNKDGLPTNEFNGGCIPAFQWLKNGMLALPSMRGLVKFNPDSLTIDVPKQRLFIDALKVDSVEIKVDSTLTVNNLSPDFNQLEIKVSCPYFGNPRNLVLMYQIQGEDHHSTWMELPHSGMININRLPAGNYQVLIKKMGYDKSSSNGSLRLRFEVLPYFYNTWWFYTMMLLLFALAGYIISRRRIATLKRKNLEVERLVNARTAELRLTTTELEVSQEALKQSNRVKEQIIAMILHDLRSPVRFLGTISHQLIRQFMDRSKADNLEDLKKLHKSVGGLWAFIEQFFGWAVSQQNAFKVHIKNVLIQEVFDDVHRFYNEILSYNGNLLDIQSSALQWNTDKDILALIIRNLLDNANKYTENGHIWIKAVVSKDKLRISVEDTGQGLTDIQVQHYMDAINGENSDGNGSIMILQMLKIIGGNLTIETKKGKGSVFTIILDRQPLSTSEGYLQT